MSNSEGDKTHYPSYYGSHKSMVVRVTALQWAEGKVTLKDESGEYETQRCRLDNGLADPNRYSGR